MKLFLLGLLPLWVAATPTGHGLVFPQSACRIRCENGGMCAFSFSDPSAHSCICLIGVYEGERCQFKVGEDPLERTKKEREQAALDKSRIAEERREAEARANDQKRREYEIKIREMEEQRRAQESEQRRAQESEQRRAQESERQRHEEAYRQREEEQRRTEEMNRVEQSHREEMRQHEERRRQHEQSLREHHEQRQNRVDDRQQSQSADEQRAREEERRQEDLRKLVERKRQEEERKRAEEQRKQKEASLNNYDPEELTDEDMEPDHSESEQIDWRERDKTDSQIQPPPTGDLDHSTITNILEKAAAETAEKHGIELGEEIETAPYEDPIDEEEDSEEHDDAHVEGVKGVLESAAEKAAEEHSIDLNAVSEEEEEKRDEDDYWDHHPKKEELEYDGQKAVESEEVDDLSEKTLEMTKKEDSSKESNLSDTNKVKEYELEDDGSWMVEKRADSQTDDSSASSFLLSFFIGTISILFFL